MGKTGYYDLIQTFSVDNEGDIFWFSLIHQCCPILIQKYAACPHTCSTSYLWFSAKDHLAEFVLACSSSSLKSVGS